MLKTQLLVKNLKCKYLQTIYFYFCNNFIFNETVVHELSWYNSICLQSLSKIINVTESKYISCQTNGEYC